MSAKKPDGEQENKDGAVQFDRVRETVKGEERKDYKEYIENKE